MMFLFLFTVSVANLIAGLCFKNVMCTVMGSSLLIIALVDNQGNAIRRIEGVLAEMKDEQENG
jgi:hypothetical protein